MGLFKNMVKEKMTEKRFIWKRYLGLWDEGEQYFLIFRINLIFTNEQMFTYAMTSFSKVVYLD